MLVLVLLLLDTQNFRATSLRHRHRARSGFMHRHGIAGRSGFKCLPRIQSIFSPEEQTTLFVVNSLVNVILAVSQQQSHRCLFSLWILTVTATREIPLRWPCLWLGWWMDLSVHTQPCCSGVDPFTRYLEDDGGRELCWLLNPLIFQSLWPLTHLTPLSHLTPSS